MSFWHNMLDNIVRKTTGYPLSADSPFKTQSKKGSGFNNLITSMQQNQKNLQQLTPPDPPSPPINLSDAEAQKQYNQELLTYNQKFQSYHMNIMQLFSQRFLALQQAMLYNRQNHNSLPSPGNMLVGPYDNRGVGGILEGDSDI